MNAAQRKLHLSMWVGLSVVLMGVLVLALQSRADLPVQDDPPRAEDGR